MKTIDVAKEFYPRLSNRDETQGDGKHTAIEFRERFLKELDAKEAWESTTPFIALDFRDVKKIGPSFANESFAYFTQYARPGDVLNRINFKNLSTVQESIIKSELESGYRR